MKRYAAMLIVIVGVGYLGSLAFANPATLPKHPGYPASSDTDPITNQPLANDPGQLNLTVEQSSREAAASEDAHVTQRLGASQDQRMMEVPDAENKVEPSMQERTRIPRSSERK